METVRHSAIPRSSQPSGLAGLAAGHEDADQAAGQPDHQGVEAVEAEVREDGERDHRQRGQDQHPGQHRQPGSGPAAPRAPPGRRRHRSPSASQTARWTGSSAWPMTVTRSARTSGNAMAPASRAVKASTAASAS